MKYIICLIFFSLLTACQTQPLNTHQGGRAVTKKSTPIKKNQKNQSRPTDRDGAPEGPLPTFFQKIFPVHAPLSRYGNPGTYRVNGHHYEVLTTSKGYHARGLASWYGTKFHSKRTSSGEDYNMYALTAAHKTLPLPTYVRVKNLNNGKVAIVRVNDRGPFHSDRIIDLSYAAAAKLGLMPKGTALVEIEALTSTSSQAHAAHYYLQAGAFNSNKLAAALRSKLSKLTNSPVFIEKYQNRFIVRVGPFAEKRKADQLKTTLQHQGLSGVFSLLM